MSNRPNYILELKDRTIEFVPQLASYGDRYICNGEFFTMRDLIALGATPVPQEEPKVKYYCAIRPTTTGPNGEDGGAFDLEFKSHEDAENYRLRCESIGPEWTDWEPEDGQTVYVVGGSTERFRKSDPEDTANRLSGIYHPTKERAQEWLDRFGKARGLM